MDVYTSFRCDPDRDPGEKGTLYFATKAEAEAFALHLLGKHTVRPTNRPANATYIDDELVLIR